MLGLRRQGKTASRVSLEQRASRSDALARVRARAIIAGVGGKIDRSTLLRKIKVDVVTFKKIVSTLILSDLLEAELSEHGKTLYYLAG